MKKTGALFILAVLLISLFVFCIQASAQDLPGNLEDIDKTLPVVDTVEKGKEKVESLTAGQLANETTWQYLGRQWKEMLLKNKVISGIDSFLTKISPLFSILFGEPYSLSLALLIVIILWFFLFFKFSQIFCDFAALSKWVSVLIAFAMSVIAAQTKFLRKITEGILWLIFVKKAWWWHLIMATICIVALILIYYFSSAIGKKTKEKKEKERKELEKIHRESTIKFGEELGKGARRIPRVS